MRTIVKLTALSQWASYLINGDASGLDDDERAACDAWIEQMGVGMPVDCEDAGFRWHHDAREFALAGDCQTYTFLFDREPTKSEALIASGVPVIDLKLSDVDPADMRGFPTLNGATTRKDYLARNKEER